MKREVLFKQLKLNNSNFNINRMNMAISRLKKDNLIIETDEGIVFTDPIESVKYDIEKEVNAMDIDEVKYQLIQIKSILTLLNRKKLRVFLGYSKLYWDRILDKDKKKEEVIINE